MKSPFLNENWLDHEKIFYGKSVLQFINVTVGGRSSISVNTQSTKEKDEGLDIDRETVIETYKTIVQLENVATLCSTAPVFSNDTHLQETHLIKVDEERTRKRLSRCMYTQIAVTHIPFQSGDSGTCIYVCDNSLERYGCIGMAIANHPGIDGGAIVTPMKDILKTFHVDIQ
ncbi:unnamed protein product [Mytilus coruscus]|uniref:Uncharacterized protein n=1 Tax=Mytilus coruscus TaxID=42192 RepID=A0A6J8AY47_MYTCO|nr:unnamed protein product [Mytilus coruscus]